MRGFMLCMLLLGGALLAVVLQRTDLVAVADRLLLLGGWGIAVVGLLYLAATVLVTASWLWVFVELPFNLASLYSLGKIFMFGSAISTVTPFAGVGGEPVKAIQVKQAHGIGYRDTSVSLILASTTSVVAMVLFMWLGTAFMLESDQFPPSYRIGTLAGLSAFSACVLAYFLMQFLHAFSRLHSWLEGFGPRGQKITARLVPAFQVIEDVEDRLHAFYSREPLRLVASIAASFGEWMLDAATVYASLFFLGHPVSFADAIVIHSFTLLVRSIFFFIPADIGTQDGSLVLACELITGSTVLGVALVAIRRARDLLWVLWGLAIGLGSSFASPSVAPDEPDEKTRAEA